MTHFTRVTRPEIALQAAAMPGARGLRSLHGMLTAQITFSVAVLFLSGLLLLSFRKLISVDPGFNRDHVILFDLATRDRLGRRRCFFGSRLLERIRHAPGIRAASLSAQRPAGGDRAWIMNSLHPIPGPRQ